MQKVQLVFPQGIERTIKMATTPERSILSGLYQPGDVANRLRANFQVATGERLVVPTGIAEQLQRHEEDMLRILKVAYFRDSKGMTPNLRLHEIHFSVVPRVVMNTHRILTLARRDEMIPSVNHEVVHRLYRQTV